MQVLYNSIKAALLLFSFTVFIVSCQQNGGPQQAKVMAKHVIIVGVDGMSPDGVEHANTPVMDSLMRHGAFSLHARGVLPTVSSPNWESMISGASPAQHGVTTNEWERNDRPYPPVVTGMEDIFPTIFGVLRQQKKDAEIGAIYQWEGFGRLFEKSAVNYDKHGEDEFETAKLAAEYIKAKKPTFTFIHFDNVDDAGHSLGHGSDGYYKAVERVDTLLGQIIQAAKDAGIYDDMVLIVTADHGGIGYGHGGETLAELEIPFIVFGKGVKQGYEMNFPIYTFDNAATVTFVFGLQQPYAWIGKPIKAAFDGFDAPADSGTKPPLLAPVIYPKPHGYTPAGGLFVDTTGLVEMLGPEQGAVTRYTIDGSDPDSTSANYIATITLSKSKVVKARAYKDGRSSNIVTAYYRIVHTGQGNGLRYNYFEGSNFEYVPEMHSMKPNKTGTVWEFRLDSIPTRPDNFAVSIGGYIQIDTAGPYRFYTFSDDGSNLYIDGKQVVNNDGDHGTREKAGDIDLKPGRHAIRVDYFQGGGGKWLEAYYRGPGIPKQIIPADKLFLKP